MKIKGKLFHICIFDPWCWKMWWKFGAPMRIHIGKKYWTLPGFAWRSKQIWDDERMTG